MRPAKWFVEIISGYDAWCGVAHGCTRKLGMKICGKFVLLLKIILPGVQFSFPLDLFIFKYQIEAFIASVGKTSGCKISLSKIEIKVEDHPSEKKEAFCGVAGVFQAPAPRAEARWYL